MVPVFVVIFGLIQREVLDQRLTVNTLAERAGAADGLMRGNRAGVHNIDRHTGHIRQHNGAVGSLALHLRRAGIGMAFRAGNALFQQLGLHGGDHIAIFSMNEGQRAEFSAGLERGKHFLVIDHQRALIGHEMLEGGDTFVHHFRHLRRG